MGWECVAAEMERAERGRAVEAVLRSSLMPERRFDGPAPALGTPAPALIWNLADLF